MNTPTERLSYARSALKNLWPTRYDALITNELSFNESAFLSVSIALLNEAASISANYDTSEEQAQEQRAEAYQLQTIKDMNALLYRTETTPRKPTFGPYPIEYDSPQKQMANQDALYVASFKK